MNWLKALACHSVAHRAQVHHGDHRVIDFWASKSILSLLCPSHRITRSHSMKIESLIWISELPIPKEVWENRKSSALFLGNMVHIKQIRAWISELSNSSMFLCTGFSHIKDSLRGKEHYTAGGGQRPWLTAWFCKNWFGNSHETFEPWPFFLLKWKIEILENSTCLSEMEFSIQTNNMIYLERCSYPSSWRQPLPGRKQDTLLWVEYVSIISSVSQLFVSWTMNLKNASLLWSSLVAV